MAEYLVSFRPLCTTRAGRAAVIKHKLPPFIDGSCRREPDLQSEFPSISAICRGAAFAPRLRKGDRIAYITAKARWLGSATPHSRFVAFLEVHVAPFSSHADAAAWYASQGLSLPSNCFANGNPPEPLDKTAMLVPPDVRTLSRRNPAAALRAWDDFYQRRVNETPVFLVCRKIRADLDTPRIATEEHQRAAFGRVPGTQTPPRFEAGEVTKFVQAVYASPATP